MSTRTIVNRFTGAVIWTGEAENTRDALLKAFASGANLSHADLFDADLSHANLFGANLSHADLSHAKVEKVGACANRSDGYDFRLLLMADGSWRVLAGCRFFTIAEARTHWTTTRGGTTLGEESLALVDHLERMGRIAGWPVVESTGV